MKPIIPLTMTSLLLTGCGQQPVMTYVFPDANPLDHIWQSGAGEVFSLQQREQGVFALHRPDTGEFFYYERDDHGAIQSSPNHAPPLTYDNEVFTWGEQTLNPVQTRIEKVYFTSDGTRMHGILTVPPADGPVPLIVNAHGSEKSAATTFDWSASWYLQAGYATFVFDKRGTGESGGRYTHDFNQLARDIQAAIDAVENRTFLQPGVIGLGGYSQGVYVSTLLASQDDRIDFLIAGYGMTESPIREDYYVTKADFEDAYPGYAWEDFAPFVEACEAAFALRDNDRWGDVKKGRKYWENRVDANDFEGTLVGDGCLRYPGWILRLFGRSQFPHGLDWDYEPKTAMSGLDIPVLWQFGEADRSAPSASSLAQVQEWQSEGKPFEWDLYPDAGHGIYLTAIGPQGDSYRYKSPAYIARVIDWLSGLNGQSE